jgi:hypothetical protein
MLLIFNDLGEEVMITTGETTKLGVAVNAVFAGAPNSLKVKPYRTLSIQSAMETTVLVN